MNGKNRKQEGTKGVTSEHKEEMEAVDRGNKMRRCSLKGEEGPSLLLAPQWVLMLSSGRKDESQEEYRDFSVVC